MKALVVEDDFTSRKILVNTLTKEQDECDVAVTGEEALRAIHSALSSNEPYQLICLDVMLPDMTGIDVLQTLRNMEEQFGIFALNGAKVIMTTGRDDSEAVLSAFKAGCEAYLIKPFGRTEFLNKVEGLVKSRGTK
jgi:two-component system chemotaxis response regulator CheY